MKGSVSVAFIVILVLCMIQGGVGEEVFWTCSGDIFVNEAVEGSEGTHIVFRQTEGSLARLGGRSWHTPECWSTGTVPTINDDVVVNGTGNARVYLEEWTAVRSLRLGCGMDLSQPCFSPPSVTTFYVTLPWWQESGQNRSTQVTSEECRGENILHPCPARAARLELPQNSSRVNEFANQTFSLLPSLQNNMRPELLLLPGVQLNLTRADGSLGSVDIDACARLVLLSDGPELVSTLIVDHVDVRGMFVSNGALVDGSLHNHDGTVIVTAPSEYGSYAASDLSFIYLPLKGTGNLTISKSYIEFSNCTGLGIYAGSNLTYVSESVFLPNWQFLQSRLIVGHRLVLKGYVEGFRASCTAGLCVSSTEPMNLIESLRPDLVEGRPATPVSVNRARQPFGWYQDCIPRTASFFIILDNPFACRGVTPTGDGDSDASDNTPNCDGFGSGGLSILFASEDCVSCPVGWTGENCDEAYCGPEACHAPLHGSCGHHDINQAPYCLCAPGWRGDHCEVPNCPGADTIGSPGDCYHRGDCLVIDEEVGGVCNCTKELWGGLDCNTAECPSDCSAHGSCVANAQDVPECVCSGRYFGTSCSQQRCSPDPLCGGNSRGTCDHRSGDCDCVAGFSGADCSSVVVAGACDGTPLNGCNSHGSCVVPEGGGAAHCVCSKDWLGDDCSQPAIACDPVDCNGGGTCDLTSGTCICDSFHAGSNCFFTLCRLSADELNNDVPVVFLEFYLEALSTLDVWLSGSEHSEFLQAVARTSGLLMEEICLSVVSLVRWWHAEGNSEINVRNNHETFWTIVSMPEPRYQVFAEALSDGDNAEEFEVTALSSSFQLPCLRDCSGKGECLQSGTCLCSDGQYTGADCSIASCPPGGVPCNNNGICLTNYTVAPFHRCSCFEGWADVDCSFATTCPNNCTDPSQGFCDTNGLQGECRCFRGWQGDDCSEEEQGVSHATGADDLIFYLSIGFAAGAFLITVLLVVAVLFHPPLQRLAFGKEGFRVEKLRMNQASRSRSQFTSDSTDRLSKAPTEL